MKVPERFHITLRGDRKSANSREIIQPALAHYLLQLITFAGELPDDFLKPWGLTVYVEEDMDQGDD